MSKSAGKPDAFSRVRQFSRIKLNGFILKVKEKKVKSAKYSKFEAKEEEDGTKMEKNHRMLLSVPMSGMRSYLGAGGTSVGILPGLCERGGDGEGTFLHEMWEIAGGRKQ